VGELSWQVKWRPDQSVVSVNEFLASRWKNPNDNVGIKLMTSHRLFSDSYWYWLSIGALVGFDILFNFLYTLALHYLDPLGNP
jgi:hypothetical protein